MIMIEKVARAVVKAEGEAAQMSYIDRSGHIARAAIEAMREPTTRMLESADSWTDLVAPYAGGNTSEIRQREFAVAWDAMIDAALMDGSITSAPGTLSSPLHSRS